MATVSRALNSPALVSPDTLQRVQAAILRTGYVPNRLAGGLASNRSRLVATIVPSITSPIFASCVQAIIDTLSVAGYEVILGQCGYSALREEELVAAVISRRPDGIIIFGTDHTNLTRRRLIGGGLPVAEVWDLSPHPIDMLVGFSHERVGAAVADFLHEGGKRRPGLITANNSRALQRVAGSLAAFKRLGIADVPVKVLTPVATPGEARAALAELLAQYPDLDAVACSSDLLALGAIIEAQARSLRVPDQLAVVGFGDLNFAADVVPSLTTVRVGAAEIGETAARFIIDKLAGRPIAATSLDVAFSIVRRASA